MKIILIIIFYIVRDLNGDKKSDVVVKNKLRADKYIFLQQEDGTHKSLDEAFEDSTKIYEKNKKSIGAKVKDL